MRAWVAAVDSPQCTLRYKVNTLRKLPKTGQALLTDVRNRGAWDDTFVDALCEPPETFTFGGMFAHVIIFNSYRRMLAINAMRRMGVKVEGFGCPEEYLASVASVMNPAS